VKNIPEHLQRVASVSPETVSRWYSIMNPIMSIVEPGRSRSTAPGLIIGLELTLTSSRWCMGRPTVYKTHAGSLGVCLLSLMSLSAGENKRARRRKKVDSPAAAWKCDCLYIDVIYCTYCTTPILLISAHTTDNNQTQQHTEPSTLWQHHRQTDRQTDGQTTYCGITALCIASRGSESADSI